MRVPPSRRFWRGYGGLALVGVTGCFGLAALATGLLLFPKLFGPWIPLALGLALAFAQGGRHGHLVYVPEEYPLVVGMLYGLAVLWCALFAWAAWTKPSSDRRLDRYLTRKLDLVDEAHTKTLAEDLSRSPDAPPQGPTKST